MHPSKVGRAFICTHPTSSALALSSAKKGQIGIHAF